MMASDGDRIGEMLSETWIGFPLFAMRTVS